MCMMSCISIEMRYVCLLYTSRYASDRRGMPVPGMQTIFKSIHPSSVKGKGDVRNASLRSAQPLFLQYHDGRDPGCDRKRGISVVQRRKIIWYGTAYVRHQQGRSVKSLRIMGKSIDEKRFFRYNRKSELEI